MITIWIPVAAWILAVIAGILLALWLLRGSGGRR
jgi:hypothetical protein